LSHIFKLTHYQRASIERALLRRTSPVAAPYAPARKGYIVALDMLATLSAASIVLLSSNARSAVSCFGVSFLVKGFIMVKFVSSACVFDVFHDGNYGSK
jgi:hypothetical protein